ncbi:IclR family transcriptional regulator [Leucobacter celer]|uniref:IclR family transcriptional regulator n=1 Tax=Leucobacter celer TaxID=668625 RepID=UPI0006A7C66E|nr:IclR family transcriptional regulator [Leucobacter celer]
MSTAEGGTRGGIQSVARALGILRQFQDGNTHRISSLAERTGLGQSTVHRLVRTLVDEGMLEQSLTDTSYRLSLGAAVIGRVAISRFANSRAAHALAGIRETLGEGTSFGIPTDGKAFVLLRYIGDREHTSTETEVLGGPPHACVLGKVFLAFGAIDWNDLGPEPYRRYTEHTITHADELRADLELTRERGYSMLHGERVDGNTAIGVPIFNATGQVTAAFSTYGDEARFDSEFVTHAVQVLQRAAGSLRPPLL